MNIDNTLTVVYLYLPLRAIISDRINYRCKKTTLTPLGIYKSIHIYCRVTSIARRV